MILVTGGTGFVGRRLVARLLAEGHAVRCLLAPGREPMLRLPPESAAPQFLSGSLLDAETLSRAVDGVQLVVHLASAQWWGGAQELERYELTAARRLVAAARAARVGRILTLSHLGATREAAWPLLRVKGLVEETIRESGLAWTILRSGLVFGEEDSFLTAIARTMRAGPLVFLMPGRGDVNLQPIHVDDLADALLACLRRIQLVDRLVEIGGPEYISLRDLLRTVMRVTGMQRQLLSVPPWALRHLAQAWSRALPRALITPQLLDLLAASRVTQIGNCWQYFGLRPRRLEDSMLTWPRSLWNWRAALGVSLRRRPQTLAG